MKKTSHLENPTLDSDIKLIDGQKYQVLVLRNKRRVARLEALHLPNGKAGIVVKEISDVLDECNL